MVGCGEDGGVTRHTDTEIDIILKLLLMASTVASFPLSHYTVNNSCQGFHGIQKILGWVANLFYLHRSYHETRSITNSPLSLLLNF